MRRILCLRRSSIVANNRSLITRDRRVSGVYADKSIYRPARGNRAKRQRFSGNRATATEPNKIGSRSARSRVFAASFFPRAVSTAAVIAPILPAFGSAGLAQKSPSVQLQFPSFFLPFISLSVSCIRLLSTKPRNSAVIARARRNSPAERIEGEREKRPESCSGVHAIFRSFVDHATAARAIIPGGN